MAERRATPRARLTISCLESEWERIRGLCCKVRLFGDVSV